MPELPEAENIVRGLREKLTGRRIVDVVVYSPRLRTSLEPLVSAGLVGLSFTDVRRRGRYAIGVLSDGRGLLMHFGMSGVVRVEGSDIPKRKHEHVFIYLDDGNIFRFEDTRRFGMLECHPLNRQGYPACLDSLGPEPLSDAFTAQYLFQQAQKHRGPVKVFLMDNSVVTGVGNIYATEVLFMAGVAPTRPACELTRPESRKIVSAIKETLLRAIDAGGTTISDFLNVDGSRGQFVQQLLIYGKEGASCPRCGGTLSALKLGGRTSCYCPKCQK